MSTTPTWSKGEREAFIEAQKERAVTYARSIQRCHAPPKDRYKALQEIIDTIAEMKITFEEEEEDDGR